MEADSGEEQYKPPALGSSPWLIYAHGKGLCDQIFYNLSERSYHVRRIPEMQQKEILTSLYGWLLLLDVRTRDLTLLNPSSMQKIQLPPFKKYFHKNWCFLLSRPPGDPNSVVMCLKNGKAQISGYGRLFAMKVEDYHVKLVDLEVQLPKAELRVSRYYRRVLVGSSDDLFVIFLYWVGRDGKRFEILKLDWEEKEWSSVENLNGHAVFFNDHRGLIAPASSESEGSVIRDNRIYLTEPDDPCLYEYDIQEQREAESLPCPKLTKNLPQPIWFLP
ncbi:hypothetical protein Tsubulata_050866 [Turnera subulata]|uniref:KIB1-4 beta-propeller domain-containing protein n=1 Tax=Turnera subulata TaxID=218843 RepID=A0A9Q0FTB4_9ROSI|nr:hypothetical protein Tsubulata_050866 [Turnera subulata]